MDLFSLFSRTYSRKKTLQLIADNLKVSSELNVWSVVEVTNRNWGNFTDTFVAQLRRGSRVAGEAFSYQETDSRSSQDRLESMLRHVQQERVKLLALSPGVDGILIGLAIDEVAVTALADSLQGFAEAAREGGIEFLSESADIITEFGLGLASEMLPCLGRLGALLVDHYRDQPIDFIDLLGAAAAVGREGFAQLGMHALQNSPVYLAAAAEAFQPIGEMAGETLQSIGESGLEFGGEILEVGGEVGDAAVDVGLDLPWITVATSSLRELSLAADGKKEWGAALGHAAADVGAVLGSLIFPGFGTFLGGAGGALIGKWFSEGVRQADLQSAVEAYNKEQEAAEGKLREQLDNLVQAYTTRAEQAYTEFRQVSDEVTRANNEAVSQYSGRLAGSVIQSLEDYRSLLRRSQQNVELPFAPDEKLQRSLDKHLRQQRFRESLLGMLDEEERRVARIQEFLRDRRNQNALEDALTHLELPRAVNEGLLQRRLQTLAQSEFVKFAAGNFVSATLVAAKARESSVQLLQSLRAGVDKIKVLSEELSIGLKRCTDRVKAEKIKVGLA